MLSLYISSHTCLHLYVLSVVVRVCVGKEFSDSEQGEEKTALLRQEMLQTQQADFLLIREGPDPSSWSFLSVFIAQGQRRERRGFIMHLLSWWLVEERGVFWYTCWLVGGCIMPLKGARWGIRQMPFLVAGRRSRPGCSKQRRGLRNFVTITMR